MMKITTYRPPTEAEIDEAVDRLEILHRPARENLEAAGRDPGEAAVLLSTWREDMGARRIWPARFRQILVELERRGLVALDGPFAAPLDPRRHEAQMAGARA